MSQHEYESALVERIKNGYLVHMVKTPPEGWAPESERPKKKFMGMELDEQDTWYAADQDEVCKILGDHYFG